MSASSGSARKRIRTQQFPECPSGAVGGSNGEDSPSRMAAAIDRATRMLRSGNSKDTILSGLSQLWEFASEKKVRVQCAEASETRRGLIDYSAILTRSSGADRISSSTPAFEKRNKALLDAQGLHSWPCDLLSEGRMPMVQGSGGHSMGSRLRLAEQGHYRQLRRPYEHGPSP